MATAVWVMTSLTVYWDAGMTDSSLLGVQVRDTGRQG